MESIIKYLGSGKIYKYPGKLAVCIMIVKFTDITEKIIPFFNDNKILGVKSDDYHNWCEVAELMKQSKHLTKDGLNKIIKIKESMNKR